MNIALMIRSFKKRIINVKKINLMGLIPISEFIIKRDFVRGFTDEVLLTKICESEIGRNIQ